MRTFARLLGLELRLQSRSFLYPATVVSTAIICGFILMLPARPLPVRLTAFFVFMDPATIGLSFVGAMVLMEKSQGTLAALAVASVTPAAYVAGKMASLTFVTIASSLVVVYVATDGVIDVASQLAAVTLCSAVAVLIGLVCVAHARSMNQLVVTLLFVTTVLDVALLAHFSVLPGWLVPAVALIPSYAMLVSLAAAVDAGSVSAAARIAAALCLGLWILIGWRWTIREFERAIVTERR